MNVYLNRLYRKKHSSKRQIQVLQVLEKGKDFNKNRPSGNPEQKLTKFNNSQEDYKETFLMEDEKLTQSNIFTMSINLEKRLMLSEKVQDSRLLIS